MWLDVFKWPEMIKYKKERDDQFAGTEGMFDRNGILESCPKWTVQKGESGRSVQTWTVLS